MYEDYRNSTDEELIDRLKQGETQITDYIMDKYKYLVRKKAKSMYILGADRDDLIQEGMIGLFKAIRDYDAGRDASFYTFADLCVSRQMYTAVQASRREKHAPLNSYVSLYANMRDNGQEESDGSETELVNILTSGNDTNPEALLIDKENVADIEAAIENELSTFEKQVLDLYMTGMSYTQIAKVLSRDEKSTDNALQRIKAKIKRAVQKGKMILLFVLCFVCPMKTMAMEEMEQQEETAAEYEDEMEDENSTDMTQVSVDTASMTISVPSSCYILQQEIAEDEPYLQRAGADRDKIQNYYKEAGIVINAIAEDESYEIAVTLNKNQDVTYLYNMQSVQDESIQEFADTIQKAYEEHGYTVEDYTLYENDHAKYIVFYFGQEYDGKAVQCCQYYTIRNSRIYNIILRSYTGEVSAQMAEMFQQVIDSIEYTDTQEALVYKDDQFGVQYKLAEGWREITPSGSQGDIQAQYMHTNGLGESIQFIARDIWGEMDMLHQLTNTRSALDAGRQLTEAEIKELYPYLKDFFTDKENFRQEQIHGEWYFVSDTPLSYESDKLNGTYQQQSIAALKNGLLYVWQYGYYVDGNLHETDYENLLEGIKYHEPEILMKDEAVYRHMVSLIPRVIMAGVVLLVIFIVVLFMYSKGTQEKRDYKSEQ